MHILLSTRSCHARVPCFRWLGCALNFIFALTHVKRVWQLYEIVTLVNELLPPLPGVSGAATASPFNCGSVSKSATKKNAAAGSSGKPEDGQHAGTEITAREQLLRSQPELLVHFGADLFPVLVQVKYFVTGTVKQHELSFSILSCYFSGLWV